MTDTDEIIVATMDVAENIGYIANNAWLTNQLLIVIIGLGVALVLIKVVYAITTSFTEGG